MTVSVDHTQILVDVNSNYYDEYTAKELFLKMDKKSEDVCNILYKYKKYDLGLLRNYIREFSLKKKDDDFKQLILEQSHEMLSQSLIEMTTYKESED